MMLCNSIPLVNVLSLLIIWTSSLTFKDSFILSLIIIYLIPPLLCRLTLIFHPLNDPKMSVNSKSHLVWWFTFNLQVIFARFSLLEEILRIVPGLYSLWLRLWGAKIGKLTYWAPKTVISDRSFIEIGDQVVIGAGTRLVPHLFMRDKRNRLNLVLSPISIGDQAVIGGYSVFGPGTKVKPSITTRAFHISKPFSTIDQETKYEDIQ